MHNAPDDWERFWEKKSNEIWVEVRSEKLAVTGSDVSSGKCKGEAERAVHAFFSMTVSEVVSKMSPRPKKKA
jgi:hypothetical protein